MRVNWFLFFFLFFRLPKKGSPISSRYRTIIKVVLRLRWALTLILVSLSVGMFGYRVLEHYTWFDAFYMSVITLSTVGFGEIQPMGEGGRLFTAILILFNLGLLGYAVSTITSIFSEGGFTKLLKDYRMYRSIQLLEQHVIVCGFGRHAMEVTEELSKQRKPFVIIESNHERIEQLKEKSEYLFIEGDATLDTVLEEARIHKAKALIITLPSDADNLFITMSARQANPTLRIISRANGQADEIKIRRAGANYTVVPERIGGFYMATLVEKPDVVSFFNLLSNMGPSNVIFEELSVNDLNRHFLNKTIQESGILDGARVSLISVRQPDGTYELNPLPTLVLHPGLHIVVLGSQEQMNDFKQKVITTHETHR